MLTCSNPSVSPTSPLLTTSSPSTKAPSAHLHVRSTPIRASPLVDTMVAAFAQLIELGLEDEAVLDVVEDHLHHMYQTAKTLALQLEARVRQQEAKLDRPALAHSLGRWVRGLFACMHSVPDVYGCADCYAIQVWRWATYRCCLPLPASRQTSSSLAWQPMKRTDQLSLLSPALSLSL
jgi:hypothetical protein